jgi:integrase/recombinase XerD
MNGIGRVRVLGPLALHADGVRSELSRLGYALGTVENHVRVMAHLSQWMADEGVEPSELSQDRVEQFFAVLKRQWKRPPTAQTLRPMLRWLRECRLVSAPALRVDFTHEGLPSPQLDLERRSVTTPTEDDY